MKGASLNKKKKSKEVLKRERLDVFDGRGDSGTKKKGSSSRGPARTSDEPGGGYDLPEDWDASESIGSDDAFNSDDEEQFGTFFAGGKPKKNAGAPAPGGKRKFTRGANDDDDDDNDDNDGEDGDEDGDEDSRAEAELEGPSHGVSLSEMLGGNDSDGGEVAAPGPAAKKEKAAQQKGRDAKAKKRGKHAQPESSSSSDADMESDSGSLGGSGSDQSSGDDAERRSRVLAAALGPKKAAAVEKPKKRKRFLDEMPHTGTADEFRADLGAEGDELTLTELMASVEDSTVRRKLRRAEKLGRALPVPLPQPQLERLTRQVAYEQSVADVSVWQPVVAANRNAEHLSFPLNAPTVPEASVAGFRAQFVPSTDMEKAVDELMKRAGATEESLKGQEALAMNSMTEEEARQRRAELAKARDLLFYYDIKRKRANKIKSKKYHKLLKKEREKTAREVAEARALDPEAADEDRLDAERRRAEERMTQRHKAKSKWAQKAMRFGSMTEESTREAIHEKISLQEELKRKVSGRTRGGGGDDDDDDDDDEDDDDGDDDDGSHDDSSGSGHEGRGGDGGSASEGSETRDKRRQQKRVQRQVEKLAAQVEQGPDQVPKGGLFKMKFMQRAMEASKKEAQMLLAELTADGNAEGALADFAADPAPQRRSFTGAQAAVGASNQSKKPRARGRDSSSSEEDHEGDQDSGGQGADAQQGAGAGQPAARAPASAPLRRRVVHVHTEEPLAINLGSDDDEVGGNNGNDDHDDDDDSDADGERPVAIQLGSTLHNAGLKVRFSDVASTRGPGGRASDEDASDEDPASGKSAEAANPWTQNLNAKMRSMVAEKKREVGKKYAKGISTMSAQAVRDLDERKGSGGAAVENRNTLSGVSSSAPTFSLSSSNRSEEQEQLIARAFASAEGDQEFAEEKAKLMAEEAPKVELATTLPGWGQWGGQTIKPKRPTAAAKGKAAAAAAATTAALKSRKDGKLSHVIINEKRDKKAAAYSVPAVPFPFQTREAFAKSISTPVGHEWNTSTSFKKAIEPAVSTRAGVIIKPLKLTKSQKNLAEAKKRRDLSGAKKTSAL